MSTKAGAHYSCSRPVFTAREHGPWTRVVCTGLYRQLHDISHFVERSLFSHHWHSAPASIGSVCRKGSVIKRLTYVQVRRKIREEHSASVHLSCQQFVVIAKWKKNSKFNDRREIVNLDKFGLSDWLDFGELNLGLREAYEKRGRGPCQVYAAAFHWSRHWSLASSAWLRRPEARQTHWTFDVKIAGCYSYFRQ